MPPEEIINQFTKKESELREIWKEYAYQQESKLQVLGPADTISGEYYQVSDFVFNDAGTRIEKIIKAPPSTLDQAGLTMTAEDKNAFINLQPFALAAEELPNYFVSYVGKEKVDDLNTYVFDVIPKVMSNKKELDRLKKQKIEGKFFQGKIWVNDQDLMIVKTAGKTVPEFEQRFPNSKLTAKTLMNGSGCRHTLTATTVWNSKRHAFTCGWSSNTKTIADSHRM